MDSALRSQLAAAGVTPECAATIALVRDALARVGDKVPPRVEYALTPLGRSLSDTVSHVVRWVQENQGEIVRHRELFDGADPAAP
ncbi:winged helix-turn-helix transcriptional regulator [Streptomyces lydicus]|uniref:winged helix-turn-helix transcriptional regulator n=1 Tax=Streptomyces lydicus TaxID=47763 RepID=UPI0033C23E51